MTPAQRTQWIGERSRAAGFDLCGVAPAAAAGQAAGASDGSSPDWFGELRHLPEWLARGYAGEMKYLHDSRRADPRRVLADARSLIVVALNYHSAQPLSTAVAAASPSRSPVSGAQAEHRDHVSPRGWISRYAWGDDYHMVIEQKLRALIADMRAQFAGPFEARPYVDTGPILERVAAKYAGLGWLAKNTCLINARLGSWLFLGVIITTLEFEPTLTAGAAPPADLCGTCTRCLDACPTQAFPEPYVLDARRCLSYLTIELRGGIPDEFRPQLGSAVIGCDICQDVCPWNRKAPVTSLAAFQPRGDLREADSATAAVETAPAARQSLFAPELEWLASLSQQDFRRVFRSSAVKRAKWRGLVRNACIALGNSSLEPDSSAFRRVSRLLRRLAASDDSLIASHARWALDRVCGASVACGPAD
jgi:epoxyqueuosine reductase